MSKRVLPIALGAAVAVVSLGAIAIPAANAEPMVVVRPAHHHHHHHHRGGWNVPPAAATMAGAGMLLNGIAHMEQAHQPVVYEQPVVVQQPVYAQPTAVMAPAGW